MSGVADTAAFEAGRTAPVCERCGAPSRVSMLVGYAAGRPVRRRWCLSCADLFVSHSTRGAGGNSRRRLSVGVTTLFGGAVVTLLGATFDQLGVHGSGGFGWMQQMAVSVAGLFVVLGALLRVDVVAVAGTILMGCAALADVFGQAGTPGVGWRQGAMVVGGLGLTLWGLHLRGCGRRTE